MKRMLLIPGLMALFAAGYFLLAGLSKGAALPLSLLFGGQSAIVSEMAESFWEDVRFKDFVKAATYHLEERRDKVDIPYILERLFFQKPEFLDILSYEILSSEIDSSGLRARVRTLLRVKDLMKNTLRSQEVILYFHRKSEKDPWYMELETSLRQLEGDKDKKH